MGRTLNFALVLENIEKKYYEDMEERDLIESRWFLPLSLHTLTPSHPPSHPHPLTPTFSYSPYIPSQLLIHPHTPTLTPRNPDIHHRKPEMV